MAKLVIESSNPNDTQADIEEKLEKALSSVKLQREGNKQFIDTFLKSKKAQCDTIVTALFQNMIKEIEQVL